MTALIAEQALNDIQLGVLLFLIAAGLTLIFGVTEFINLRHGALFMMGAYLAVTFQSMIGTISFARASWSDRVIPNICQTRTAKRASISACDRKENRLFTKRLLCRQFACRTTQTHEIIDPHIARHHHLQLCT
ncbi:hypothetical protein [Paracoccus onubensis]|uniref:Branched-chain amino acid ABC transporter permease n=1 Tax=Paracoccus onubensis TaxID=1675788 RepID=A0A418SY23_9RHOB|nr:hypothetical protein D3P04_08810 [Paracoccus onubensis]